MGENLSVRIDKWLWAVRLYKTRSIATEACRTGAVKVDGSNVKPSREVRIGELIVAKTGDVHRTVRVVGLIGRRVSAKEVGEFAEDQTPPEEFERRRERAMTPVAFRPKGSGRPTKKERRQLDHFKDPE